MSIYKINNNLPTKTKISTLSDMLLELDGLIDKANFNVNELTQMHTDLNIDRKFLRDQSLGNSLSTYSGWSHVQAESGYSIWKFAPTSYTYNVLNALYLDSKILENRGEANAETATSFTKVFLYNGDSGSGYVDNTTEAATEIGTEFAVMNTTNDYLYVGAASTFSGVKFEFQTRGANYTLKVEYFDETSGVNDWVALTEAADNLEDNTSNFASDGAISWTTPDAWGLTLVNSQNLYWIRISTTTTPVTTAETYYIIPNNSVVGLLALSSSEILNEDWAWCTYGSYVYVTLRNTGESAYEGDYYITSSSSTTNKQNYFIYNHAITADYEDSTYVATTSIKRKTVMLKVIADDTVLTTGDGKMYFTVPSLLNGMVLIDADAAVYTVSSSGAPTIQIHNVTDSADMLSTRITIDANEFSSYTAATPAVINTSYDDVVTGDRLRVDVDVAGTGTKGLEIALIFE